MAPAGALIPEVYMKIQRFTSGSVRTTIRRKKTALMKTNPVKHLVTAKGHRTSTGITRIDTILFALHQSGGVTLADLTVVTGWQAHSVRAALYRLRQAGHAIVSLRSGGL